MEIQDTLESIIKSIVDTPEQVSIETSVTPEGITNLSVSAPSEIIGQIIGKEGKIIKSIRNLLNLAFPNIRYNLEIKD